MALRLVLYTAGFIWAASIFVREARDSDSRLSRIGQGIFLLLLTIAYVLAWIAEIYFHAH